jgi:hypothetical protein
MTWGNMSVQYDLRDIFIDKDRYVSIGYDESLRKMVAVAKLSGKNLKENDKWEIIEKVQMFETDDEDFMVFNGVLQNVDVRKEIFKQRIEINKAVMLDNDRDINFVIGNRILNERFLEFNEVFTEGAFNNIWLDIKDNCIYLQCYCYLKNDEDGYEWYLFQITSEGEIKVLENEEEIMDKLNHDEKVMFRRI